MVGIDAFSHKAVLKDVKVTGSGGNGGNEFIKVPLTTVLQNPSKVSLHTTQLDLPVFFQNVQLGQASISVDIAQSLRVLHR